MRTILLSLPMIFGNVAYSQGPVQVAANQSDLTTGIIHGPNHAYMITAPKGWVLDNEVWAEGGIFAVFYKVNCSIDTSPIVAYTMVQEKLPQGIEAHIKADMVHTLKGSKTAKVVRHTPIKSGDGRIGIVYSVVGVPKQNPEWMAYIDAPTVYILVSVSVRDVKDFTEGQKLLKDLVSSVSWFTDQVQYNK